MKNKIVSVAVLVAVVVGAGAFYGGMQYQKSIAAKTASSGRQQFAGGGQGGMGRRGAGGQNGGFVGGDIISKDDKSITVKSRDGGSKIVFLSQSTSVGKTVAGASSDLTVGEQVVVNGTANSDGSVTAQNIQIRPAGQNPQPAPGK